MCSHELGLPKGLRTKDSFILVAAPAPPSVEAIGPVLLTRFQGFTVLDGDVVSGVRFEEPEVDRSGVIGDVTESATLVPSVPELVALPSSVTADRRGESHMVGGGSGAGALQYGDGGIMIPGGAGDGAEESAAVD